MTTDPSSRLDQPVASGFQEGIYLEKKKRPVGTGDPAKTAEQRNFWATGHLSADSAMMFLLNDEFKPTGRRETFNLAVLTGPDWFFIAEGEKKYQWLRPHLDRLLENQPQPPAAPANPFELKKNPRPPAPPKKGGWWER